MSFFFAIFYILFYFKPFYTNNPYILNGDIMVEKRERMLGFNDRILKPSEFNGIREQPKKYESKFILDLLLNTGMRFSELKRFVENLNSENNGFEWFKPEEDTIILPKHATKTKRKREVFITPTFKTSLLQYMEIKGHIHLPATTVMDDNLKRWAKKADIEDPTVIAIKTFRKTIESWLCFGGKNMIYVLSSQGHSNTVALQFYIKKISKWSEEEKKDILKMTQGWGE